LAGESHDQAEPPGLDRCNALRARSRRRCAPAHQSDGHLPDTERETKAHCDAIVAYADPVANRQIFDSDAHVWKGRVGVDTKSQRAIGGNIEVAGTPKQVMEQFVRLKEAGIDGLQLSFFDVQSDLDHFGARVLPLMKQAGLRP
jgi:dimethylsulfone monooxygenase